MAIQHLFTAALLLPLAVHGLYSKSSPVLQVDAKSFDKLINRSNHTSIVEFYAPWCGHCKNLQPAYEKAASNLNGLAQVAAVDCDDDSNKSLCGSMGVKGFPTLKIIKPGKKPGKPIVEDYNGARSAKAIVEAVVDKMLNHVKRLTDKDYEEWIEDGQPKAVLFSDKPATSTLLKALAIDFLGRLPIAQIRNTQTAAVEKFGVQKFPTLILLPGGEVPAAVYDGEMKKDAMLKFLSQAAPTNDGSDAVEGAKTNAQTDPIATQQIPTVIDSQELHNRCLDTTAGTCVLVLHAEEQPSSVDTLELVSGISDIVYKHSQAKRKLFPFLQVPRSNTAGRELQNALALTEDVQLLAINSKRGWYNVYEETGFSSTKLNEWIDAIRMNEMKKIALPDVLRENVSGEAEEESASHKATTNDQDVTVEDVKEEL